MERNQLRRKRTTYSGGGLAAGLLGIILLLGLVANKSLAIEVTRTPTGVLLHEQEKAFQGYTLLQTAPDVLLIDMEGNIVHRWTTGPGGDAQLTPEGHLIRASGASAADRDGNPLNWGGTQGRLREWDWEGNLLWDIDLAEADEISHHTFKRIPNGNTLVVIWERYSRKQAIKKGRHPATVNPEGATGTDPRPGVYTGDFWPDKIIEISHTGLNGFKVEWEWRAWDHLCNRAKRNCIDINYHIPLPTNLTHRSSADYLHVNAVDYDEENDLVLINSRVLGEFYLIDHESGDIIYRWGNPCAWDKKAACPSYMQDGDTYLFGAHGANFIESEPGAVKILVFDNGWLRPSGNRSRALDVEVDLDHPDFHASPVWSYQTASANSLNSDFVSYAQRLDNGNTLITSGMENHLIEVTAEGEVVWEYVIPDIDPDTLLPKCENVDGADNGFVFRSYRYDDVYLQEAGVNLDPPTPYLVCD